MKASLDFLGGTAGTFRYAPIIGPDILSGILASVAGQPTLDFARENLFLPLGIDIPGNIQFQTMEEQLAFYEARSVSGWVADPKGRNSVAWGLALRAMDMAKIGQLYLNDGVWKNRQIVPEAWIKESTREQSRWKEMNLPYGFLWWITGDGSYAAMGDGGNVIYVNPAKGLVVALASYFMPMQEEKNRIQWIKEVLEPMI